MPYINKNKRKNYDKIIQEILNILKKVPKDSVDGELNYVISMILKGLYDQSYYDYNRAIGMLESVKQEYYRRNIAPYEDKKIIDNSDI